MDARADLSSQAGAPETKSEVRCPVAEVPEGCAKKIALPGRAPIAVYQIEGVFYATDDTCTHGEASLCDGWLDGPIVECPFHAGTFDVRTGDALAYPAQIALKTYPVRVEGSFIVVQIS
jgi:nitrite reductase/ring-hydroxylating ferredoxin subunit